MFSRFDKAHVAGIAAAITGLVTALVPDVPAEAAAGIGFAAAWLLTYLIPNKG